MPLLYEHRRYYRTGPKQEVGEPARFCERHWNAGGKADYEADRSRKELATIEVENPSDYCPDCEFEKESQSTSTNDPDTRPQDEEPEKFFDGYDDYDPADEEADEIGYDDD